MEKLLCIALLPLLATLLACHASASTIPLTPVSITSEQAAQRHEFRLQHSPYYRRLHGLRQNAGLFRELDARQRSQTASGTPSGRWNRAVGAADVDTGNSTLVQQVLDYVQSLDLLTKVTVGTPGQEILTFIEFLNDDFYFLDSKVVSGASLFGSSEDSTVGDRYCPANSSSASVSKTFFYAEYGNIDGVVANDTLTLAGYDNSTVALNATFGDATVAVHIPTEYNGVIGVLPYSVYSNNMNTDALSQMETQLENPVFAYYLNLNTPPTAALSVGHLDTENCLEDSATFFSRSTIDGNSSYSFDVQSVSATVTKTNCSDDGQNCWKTAYTYRVDTTKEVEVAPFLPAILTSTEVLNVFVAASGAVYNNDTTLYELADCDAAVKSAEKVTLAVVGGQSLVITPLDYVTEISWPR
jgi:hypothetical protein